MILIIHFNCHVVEKIRHIGLTSEMHATSEKDKSTYPGPVFPLRINRPFSFVDWRV